MLSFKIFSCFEKKKNAKANILLVSMMPTATAYTYCNICISTFLKLDLLEVLIKEVTAVLGNTLLIVLQ